LPAPMEYEHQFPIHTAVSSTQISLPSVSRLLWSTSIFSISLLNLLSLVH
jgi:hypothetical protein